MCVGCWWSVLLRFLFFPVPADIPGNSAVHVKWQSADKLSAVSVGDAIAFLKTLSSDSVDCVWTDPPYFLSNGGTTCVKGQRVTVNKGAWDRSNGWKNNYEFHTTWIREC